MKPLGYTINSFDEYFDGIVSGRIAMTQSLVSSDAELAALLDEMVETPMECEVIVISDDEE